MKIEVLKNVFFGMRYIGLIPIFFSLCLVVLPVSVMAATKKLNTHALVALVNTDRTKSGLSLLTEDARLTEAAQRKANDMVQMGYFSHISPSGVTPWSWLVASQYYYMRAGENLAMNFSDAKSLEAAWMNSPAHRSNLLSPEYSKVGLGVAQGMYLGKPVTFVVQFFAAPYIGKGMPTIAKSQLLSNVVSVK